MSKLNELRQERSEAITAARELLDKADVEKRSLTDEESASYDSIMTKQDELRTKIEREERQVELDREIASQTITNQDDENRAGHEEGDDSNIEIRALNKAFSSGFTTLDEGEIRALKMGQDDAGGYLVTPIEWMAQVLKKVDDAVFMRQLGTGFTTSAQSLGVPSIENDPADSDWTTELGIGSEDSTLDFGSRELAASPVAKLLKVSNTLLQHAPNAESIVSDRLAYKMAVTQEKAYLTGSGANQPLGVFTASANGISTGRDVSTGNSTTAIVADNLRTVKYTLKGQYHAAATWLFHRDLVAMISKLKDGNGQYIWQPGITAGDPDRLLNLPMVMSEYAPNTLTTGLYVGMLGDFSNYWYMDALQAQIQRLNELYAATNQVGFISRFEGDGMPVLEEAFVRIALT